MGLFADRVSVVGVSPGDCEMGMPQSLLYIKRVRASLQKQGCVRMTKAVEVKEGHIQLLVNYSAGVLQCAGLNEGSIFANIHKVDRSSNRAEVAELINTNLLVSFSEILLRSLLPLIFILQ